MQLLSTQQAFERWAQEMADRFKSGDIVLLTGELGTGKTTFVQEVMRHWGSSDTVSSPTFQLIHRYTGKYPVIHMDLYRLAPPEAEALDLPFYLLPEVVTFIEWADRLTFSKESCIEIQLAYGPTQTARWVQATFPG